MSTTQHSPAAQLTRLLGKMLMFAAETLAVMTLIYVPDVAHTKTRPAQRETIDTTEEDIQWLKSKNADIRPVIAPRHQVKSTAARTAMTCGS